MGKSLMNGPCSIAKCNKCILSCSQSCLDSKPGEASGHVALWRRHLGFWACGPTEVCTKKGENVHCWIMFGQKALLLQVIHPDFDHGSPKWLYHGLSENTVRKSTGSSMIGNPNGPDGGHIFSPLGSTQLRYPHVSLRFVWLKLAA